MEISRPRVITRKEFEELPRSLPPCTSCKNPTVLIEGSIHVYLFCRKCGNVQDLGIKDPQSFWIDPEKRSPGGHV